MVKQQHKHELIILLAVAILTAVLTTLGLTVFLYLEIIKPIITSMYGTISQILAMLRVIGASISNNQTLQLPMNPIQFD